MNNIFFLHIVNVMNVVLGWVYQIKTKASEAKLRAGLFEWFARRARNLNFWALLKQSNGCGGERMFLTYGKKHQTLITNRQQEREGWVPEILIWFILLIKSDFHLFIFDLLRIHCSSTKHIHIKASMQSTRNLGCSSYEKTSFKICGFRFTYTLQSLPWYSLLSGSACHLTLYPTATMSHSHYCVNPSYILEGASTSGYWHQTTRTEIHRLVNNIECVFQHHMCF